MASNITEVPFFSSKVKLGKNGERAGRGRGPRGAAGGRQQWWALDALQAAGITLYSLNRSVPLH